AESLKFQMSKSAAFTASLDARPVPCETPAIVVTELFPPAIGGSGVLLENVYSRIGVADVSVLSDANGPTGADEQRGNLRILRRPTLAARWGVAHPAGLAHHARVGRMIHAMLARRRAVVHCGRAL